jgi:pimeloyl-ACP methyl ester carboxylesterase
MKTDLHFSEIGQSEPIVFIHGGFDPAEETFGDQKELADQYRVRGADGRRRWVRAVDLRRAKSD